MSLRSIIAKEASLRPFGAVADESGRDRTPLEPGRCYIRLWLSEMRISHERELWKMRYPIVQSVVGISAPGTAAMDLPGLAGPGALRDLAGDGVHRVVSVNHVLLRGRPYVGGQIDLAVGLFSVTSNDVLGLALDVLGRLSDVVGAQPLRAALGTLAPLRDGLERLVGMDDVKFRLGLRTTLAPGGDGTAALADGYVAVLNEGSNVLDDFHIVGGSMRHRKTKKPPTGEFMVLRIESLDRLPDWEQQITLLEPAKDAVKAAAAGKAEDAARAREHFIEALFACDDLIHSDKVRILRGLEQRLASLKDVDPDQGDDELFAGARETADFVESLLADAPEPPEAAEMDLAKLARRR
jgi:hypothetical protein